MGSNCRIHQEPASIIGHSLCQSNLLCKQKEMDIYIQQIANESTGKNVFKVSLREGVKAS